MCLDKALEHVKKNEGGYVNDSEDRGGETNHGITQKTLDIAIDKGLVPPGTQVANLNSSSSDYIYENLYWDAPGINLDQVDQIDEGLALATFDFVVNSGQTNAIKELQLAMEMTGDDVDGILGSQTLKALSELSQPEINQLITDYSQRRRDFVQNIVTNDPTQKKFLAGWLNRIDGTEQVAKDLNENKEEGKSSCPEDETENPEDSGADSGSGSSGDSGSTGGSSGSYESGGYPTEIPFIPPSNYLVPVQINITTQVVEILFLPDGTPYVGDTWTNTVSYTTYAPATSAESHYATPGNPGSQRYGFGSGGGYYGIIDPGAPFDPLVLDLDGNGVGLISVAESNSMFDLNGDGFSVQTSWIDGADAFVALDRNGDGTINDGSELFGNESMSGFEMLTQLDSNNDGILNIMDDQYSSLLLWKDENGDGVSQSDELVNLYSFGIESINLSYSETDAAFELNGRIARVGEFTWTDEAALENDVKKQGTVADLELAVNATMSDFTGSFSYFPAVQAVADIEGYGFMADLHVAMSMNETLRTNVIELVEQNDVTALIGEIDNILVTWAGAENVVLSDLDADSEMVVDDEGNILFEFSNEVLSLEQLGVIKAYLGEEQLALSGDNLFHSTEDEHYDQIAIGGQYRQTYNEIRRNMLVKFAVSNGMLDEILPGIGYDVATDYIFLPSDVDVNQLFDDAFEQIMLYPDDQNLVNEQLLLLGALIENTPELSVLFNQEIEKLVSLGNGDLVLALDNELVQLFGAGTSNADHLYGGTHDDEIYGFAGNDLIRANGGDDFVDGGEGNDHIVGDSGADTLLGGNGNDSIWSGTGDDEASGGIGNDFIFGDLGDDIIFGNEGSDELAGWGGDDQIWGNSGDDLIHGQDGDDILVGGEGEDTIISGTGNDSASGGLGNDVIYGNDGDDDLSGGNGQDKLFGGEGSDIIHGNEENDELLGESGNDFLYGEKGSDLIIGGEGDDKIWGGEENDELYGQTGSDLIWAEEGDDKVDAGQGNDTVYGGEGNDSLFGHDGDDVLSGGDGHDTIGGWNGSDIISGGNGDDILHGQSGNDEIQGDEGNDFIVGGDGLDSLVGGNGDDSIFGQEGNDEIIAGSGDDYIDAGVGENNIEGNLGNDFVASSFGNNKINGGEGIDTISYELIESGVNVNLESGTTTSEGSSKDSFTGIENVIASDFDDTIVGNYLSNSIIAGNGDDIVSGGVGDDVLNGGDGSDILDGGHQNDSIYGGAGNDQLNGGTGVDLLEGNSGSDILDGGHQNDILDGGSGNDYLIGGTGNDKLHGGEGDDYLEGGYGDDTYSYIAGGGHDTISDGNWSNDSLNLEGINSEELIFTRNEDSLVIKFGNQDGSVTVENWYKGQQYQLDVINTDDGSLRINDINKLIENMASMSPELGSDVVSTIMKVEHTNVTSLVKTNYY